MKKILVLIALSVGVFFVSCSKDDDGGPSTTTIALDTAGLKVLSGGSTYQGWLIVDGKPKPTSKFTDPTGIVNLEAFTSDIEKATQFILTIEPYRDEDDAPSDSKILIGNFNGNTADLDFASVVADLKATSGEFVLKTPTDDVGGVNNGNDQFGVWFVNSQENASLVLPVLASGWIYEGWVDFESKILSTGRFSKVTGIDQGNFYSGSGGSIPEFPGEDFLMIPNQVPVSGIELPAEVTGKRVFITVEPIKDFDPAPFFIEPLSGVAGITTGTSNSIVMNSNTTTPSGIVTRSN